MRYGISELSIIPMRKHSKDQSEMVSQVLFGETYTILEEQEKWLKIELNIDKYQGWIDKKMHTEISLSFFDHIKSCSHCTNTITKVEDTNQMIAAGSFLPLYQSDNRSFRLSSRTLKIKQSTTEKHISIIDTVKSFIHSPYLWGGRTHFGIDCSGFSQITYKIHGINIPRDAKDQALIGDLVANISEAKIGDLAFFENDNKNITHVGIIYSKNEIIHASAMVRIDFINDKGIYTREEIYTHKLNCIKRIIK